MNDNEIAESLLAIAESLAGSGRAATSPRRRLTAAGNVENAWKAVESALIKLWKQNKEGYYALMEEWRDVLPHTGGSDVMLGSPKFAPWVMDSFDNDDTNWADLLDDIQRYLTGRKLPGAVHGSTSRRLTAAAVDASSVRKALDEAHEGLEQPLYLLSWLLDKRRLDEVEQVLQGAGGRSKLYAINNALLSASLDLGTFSRKVRNARRAGKITPGIPDGTGPASGGAPGSGFGQGGCGMDDDFDDEDDTLEASQGPRQVRVHPRQTS